MFISEITEIENYRNLTGRTIRFNDELNFFIGENNVGKTNILELINIFFSGGRFGEYDFHDVLKPVRVKMKIEHDIEDEGFPDGGAIEVTAFQESVDDGIVYYRSDCEGEKAGAAFIKMFNVLYYNAGDIYDGGSGSCEGGRPGPRGQYGDYIIGRVMETIEKVKRTRSFEAFQKRLVHRNGLKLFPVILVLDEPEIHLHPYNQRSLVNMMAGLMNNENREVAEKLKADFDIDGLEGQIFIATHSPNILMNDYHQFIRIFKANEGEHPLQIVSGMDISLDRNLYKHMLHNFIYLKEAMFSKCVVFVEGDTESGAIPVFAERMGVDMDAKGIGVIKLDGADSVRRCMNLYRRFGIRSFAIIDRDKEVSYQNVEGIYFTEGMDYEEDVYNNFELADYMMCCRELGILDPFVPILEAEGIEMDRAMFKEDPSCVNVPRITADKVMAEHAEKQIMRLRSTKNAARGAILAEYVTSIPKSFESVINRLVLEVEDGAAI